MSETFVKAWEVVRERVDEIRNLKAFLWRIADNLVIDHYRRKGRAPVALTEEMEETLPHDARIEERVDGVLARDELAGALGKLREETRKLLVMRYIDDLPIATIAEMTGRNANAVYVAIHRAVKELKDVCTGA
jgi:RNA polymerase sigma-70 factor (ECF subfamily)